MRVIVLALSLFLAGAAGAQSQSQQVPAATPEQNVKAQQERAVTQPGNNAPFYREVRGGQSQYTTSSARGPETGVLVQSAGDTWRRIRNGPVTFYGGAAVLLVLVILAALYFGRGPIKLHEPPTGRLLQRFSDWERVVHWSVAISFCVLGLSGLIMLFGKYVLLPVIGYTLFGWLSYLCKNLHNFIAPFFILSVAVMAVMWVKDNLWKSYDWAWFKTMWGFFMRGDHVPSGRFNAMEKAWFWGGVWVLSIVMIWSGLILLFPNFDQTRATMQEAWVWHAVAALAYMAVGLGHIYMGTIGVEGAYRNMREGVTDETWAKEHHSIWYEEMKSGRRAVAGGAIPAGAPHMKEKP